MKVGKLSNKFNALYYRSVGLAYTNFCFDFSNTVQHAHVQPLKLSTASSQVEVTRVRSKFRQVGVMINQTRNCVFRLAKTKAQQARLALQG